MKKEEFRQLIRDYFTFTVSERNGMILLCTILLVVVILNQFSGFFDFKKPVDQHEFLSVINQLKVQDQHENLTDLRLFAFDPNKITNEELEILKVPLKIKSNLIHYRQKGGKFRNPDDFRKLYGMNDSLFAGLLPYIRMEQKTFSKEFRNEKVVKREYFEFDPNLVSEEQLKKLGFTVFQIKNLLAFRSKGGKFNSKSDILKVYGVDSSVYKEMYEWIKVIQPDEALSKEWKSQVIELNVADSLQLMKLPGIGQVFAGRIIRYRRSLGGFSSVEQLEEVYGMKPETLKILEGLVKADKSLIIPIRLNFADYSLLNRHPYIDGKQASAIINWRSTHGPFSNKELLLENGFFDKNLYNKLEPYLTCQ
jgi:DNA uptake protein ComE-like DNA-binding protein